MLLLPITSNTDKRFQCGKPVACYLGLVPLEESSGERRRLGHSTKQGNSLLRFLRVEAAQVTVRSLPEWRSHSLSGASLGATQSICGYGRNG
jgi:transposase